MVFLDSDLHYCNSPVVWSTWELVQYYKIEVLKKLMPKLIRTINNAFIELPLHPANKLSLIVHILQL